MMGIYRQIVLLLALLSYLNVITADSALDKLNPSEVALVQFDSRDMDSYWLASANWNKFYCDRHGHKFFYYQAPKGQCLHNGDVQLADPWCKVRTMQQVMEDHHDVKLFIYMDSDAVVDVANLEVSALDFAKTMATRLEWNVEEKPIVFNQDGPCWWCNLVAKKGYKMCLNAGTVMWYRHQTSSQVLDAWWASAMDSYEGNKLQRKFRTSWPWEQDRQMAIYERTPEKIQVSSHPHLPYMPRVTGSRKIEDWCFSHLPGSGCFISHFCANHGSKQILSKKYTKLLQQHQSHGATVHNDALVGRGVVPQVTFDVEKLRMV
jgi:hypothetical protein